MLYVVAYLVTLMSAFYSVSTPNSRRSYVTWVLVTFFLILSTIGSSVRWQTGTDWSQYYTFYSGFRELSQYLDVKYFEPGYSFINWLGRTVDSYNITLMLQSLIINACWFLAIFRLSPYPMISVYILFCTKIFLLFPVRQDIAIALVYLGFSSFLIGGVRIKSLATSLIGILFHSSAVISTIYYLPRYRITYIRAIAVLATMIVLGTSTSTFSFMLDIFSGTQGTDYERLSHYLSGSVLVEVDGVDYGIRNIVRLLEAAFLLGVFINFSPKVKTEAYDRLLSIYFLGSVVLFFSIFDFRILLRFVPYFSLTEVFIVPMILQYLVKKGIRDNKLGKAAISEVAVVFVLIIFYLLKLIMTMKGFWIEFVPYKSILW